ncbi:hypothetical protein KDL44_07320 [bacterium]|nr:hypothetical protein [bacterium]
MAKGKGSSSRSRGLLSNPQVRAKALMNQAYTHPDIDKAIDLALQATQCWPDCAEALMFLAMYLPEDQYQAAGMCSQAFHAASRAMGEVDLEQQAGKLWDDEAGRISIKALSMLARSIVDLTLYEDAWQKFNLAILLDENDNLGNHYYSVACAVACGDYESAMEILEEWDDPKDGLQNLGWLLANLHSGLRSEVELESVAILQASHSNLLQWMVDPLSVKDSFHLEYCDGDVEEVENVLGLYSQVFWLKPDSVEWLIEAAGLEPRREYGPFDLEDSEEVADIPQA